MGGFAVPVHGRSCHADILRVAKGKTLCTGCVVKVSLIDLMSTSAVGGCSTMCEASPGSPEGQESRRNQVEPLGMGGSEDSSEKGPATQAQPAITSPWHPRKCKLFPLFKFRKSFSGHGPGLRLPIPSVLRRVLEEPMAFLERLLP